MKRVLFLFIILFQFLIITDSKYQESYISCNACCQVIDFNVNDKEKVENGDTSAMKRIISHYHSLNTDKAEERALLLEEAIDCEKHYNHTKAKKLIDKAFYNINLAIKADNGDTDAAFKLASYYEKLERKGYRDTLTFYLYSLASRNANIKARTKIGMCYEEGRGVKKNIKKAVRYYFRSAELGEPEAMIRLGDLYRKGEGVDQSDFLAYDYYRKALESDSIDTLLMILPRLEECYIKGIGADKDLFTAELLNKTEKAIKRGNTCSDNIIVCKDLVLKRNNTFYNISAVLAISIFIVSLRRKYKNFITR